METAYGITEIFAAEHSYSSICELFLLDSSMIYSNWARDNPDLNSDACVVLSASKGYRWDDEGCDQENHYICEKREDDVITRNASIVNHVNDRPFILLLIYYLLFTALPGFSLKVASTPETTSSVPTSSVPRNFSPTTKDRINSGTDGERPERKNDGKKRRIKIERKTTARYLVRMITFTIHVGSC